MSMIVSPDSMKLLGTVQESQEKSELLAKLEKKAVHLAAEGKIVDRSSGCRVPPEWKKHFFADAMELKALGEQFRKVCPDAQETADALENKAMELAFFAGSCLGGAAIQGQGYLQPEVKVLEAAIEVLKK